MTEIYTDKEKKYYKADRKNITKELRKMKPEYYNMVLEYLKDCNGEDAIRKGK